jgi:imidazolonepropionase-like amidohydrolase
VSRRDCPFRWSGTLGRLEPGALADLLVVDGNPAQGLEFLNDPEKNLRLIMKTGRVYKDSL